MNVISVAAWILLCTLACIGIGAVIGDFMFNRPRKPQRCNYRIITLYDNKTEVEKAINRHLLRIGWSGPDAVIILVDMGMGDEALAACNRLRKELYSSRLCKLEELPDVIEELDSLNL